MSSPAKLLVGLCFAAALLVHAAGVRPISDAHRAAATELFSSAVDSFSSLEETYEALKTFQILKIEKSFGSKCQFIKEKYLSSSAQPKNLSYALKISGILGCQIDAATYEAIVSKLQSELKEANSLLEIYYSIGGLLSIKDQGFDVALSDADSVLHAIKALSQSDGKWRYDTNNADSSTIAAGIAFEAAAGVVALANSEIDISTIEVIKSDIKKLFDSIKSYDDGTYYFDEKIVDSKEYNGPLTATASVVRGLTSFAAVAPGKLNIPGDKILGLAKFFLGIGLPGSPKDFFNQIYSLSCLDNNRISIPLILSLPDKVLSLTSNDQLKVEVTTVFGLAGPPLKVNLVQVLTSGLKDVGTESKELQFDRENSIHYSDITSLKLDVGKYLFVFEVLFNDQENAAIYTAGGHNKVAVFLTGYIKVDKAEIGILDSDFGTLETVKTLDLSKDSSVSLSATHLQKLQLSFQLTSPLGRTFKPHQVFLKLKHETGVEHLFIIGSSSRQFKIVLDLLGLVEKFYYLSGKYGIELAVGDAAMENSFHRAIGFVELDLPEAPEKAPRPPPQAVDPYTRFGPKEEISHIFRAPEKRPPEELSLAFMAITALPLIGFMIGLFKLKINFKGFPSQPVPAVFAIFFHAGIAAVLLLYTLFWLKLDLFTTLRILGVLGVFLVFVGHRTLSHLASASAKQKTA